jgi:hypothetical protein
MSVMENADYETYLENLSHRLVKPNMLMIWSTWHPLFPQVPKPGSFGYPIIFYILQKRASLCQAFPVPMSMISLLSAFSTHFLRKNGDFLKNPSSDYSDQGDRIGRTSAYWAFIYFGHFFK